MYVSCLLVLSLVQECKLFSLQGRSLREAIDRTGRAYASALDLIVHGPVVPSDSDSYASALNAGESLEHFHLFNRPNDGPEYNGRDSKFEPAEQMKQNVGGLHHDDLYQQPLPTLVMHSDIGLFIVMT